MMQRTLKQIMLQNIVTLLVIIVAFLLFLRWRAPKMVFYPDSVNYGQPKDFGLQHEEVWLKASEGVRIHGWFLPADEAIATVLFLHGNAANITARLEKLEILHRAKVSVLIIDYRGYGQSGGKISEEGTYRDADAAYAWLVNDRKIDPSRLILYGESLGCGPAVDLAAREKVGGVILESGFTSIPDKGREIYPFLPVRWISPIKYDNLAKIRRVAAPVLIIHSRGDEIFPFVHAEKLFAAANQPKELFEMRGDHNAAFFYTGAAYEEKIRQFSEAISKKASR